MHVAFSPTSETEAPATGYFRSLTSLAGSYCTIRNQHKATPARTVTWRSADPNLTEAWEGCDVQAGPGVPGPTPCLAGSPGQRVPGTSDPPTFSNITRE